MRPVLRVVTITMALAGVAAAPAAAQSPIGLGPGRDPSVAVAPDGTAHIAFNGTEPGNSALRFCRLPRGTTACDPAGTIPAPGTSATRPFVAVDGSTVRVVAFRYGEGVPGFSAVYLFVSTDGGRSFGAGSVVGTQDFRTAVAGPGTGVSLASNADGAGGRYQRVPVDGSAQVTQAATLSASYLYDGAVGLLDAATPVVVLADGSGNAIARRYNGAGQINDAASWTAPQNLGVAASAHLAGGPAGLFLLSRAADGRLEVRRHGTDAFGPAVAIPDGTGETQHAHLTQDPGGRLHAVWPRIGGTVEYAASDDGTGFSRGVVARDPDAVFGLRAAAAADHAGVAVWQSAPSSSGVIRVAPIPPPTGPPPAGPPADTEPPDTFVTGGPASGATVATPPTFEFSAGEPVPGFECSTRPSQLDERDGPVWGPCTSPYRAPGFGFTAVTFRVRAVDAAGNADPTPARVDYFSDPTPYGNVRVRGIDVFQLVQPNSGAAMFAYDAARPAATTPFPNYCGAGTPFGGTILAGGPGAGRLCQAAGDPRRVPYRGVPLDTRKPATAFVYVGMEGARSSDPAQPLDVTLVGLAPNGRQIGPTLVQRITDPPVSPTSWVTGGERRGALGGGRSVRFDLPSAWLGTVPVTLRATVAFAPGTRSWNEAECTANACDDDNTFALVGIPKVNLPEVLVTPLLLRTTPTAVVGSGAPRPEEVFDVIRHVVPGGERIGLRSYAGTLDVSAALALTAAPVPALPPLIPDGLFFCNGRVYGPPAQDTVDKANRACRQDAVQVLVDQWVADNPPRYTGGDGRLVEAYDLVAAIFSSDASPGWQWGGNIRDVGRSEVGNVPRAAFRCCTRPLTSATHEILHAYTAPHAGQNCPGTAAGAPQAGEPWAGDDQGRLQGILFDRRVPQLDLDDPTNVLYDLMSYCASTADTGNADSFAARANVWISPRSWNRVVAELVALRGRVGAVRDGRGPSLGKRRRSRAAQAPARGPAFATGLIGPQSGRVVRVVAPDEADGIPADDPGSAVRLRSLAADGAVLLDVGVRVQVGSESSSGSGGTFVARVAPASAAVELVRDGTVLDRMQRDAAPTVRLRAPRAGTRVREAGRLAVRWTAADPDPGDREALRASVDVSDDDGRTWRTAWTGAGTGSATLRGDALPGSPRGRVRVTVDDGFSSATARSGALRFDGRRPDVTITAPARGSLARAGIPVRLAATAIDARGAALSGRSVRWFAGRRALGPGSELTASLPAGRLTLRAVATDTVGRRRTVTRRVTVAPNDIRLLRLDAPRTVGRAARSVAVRVAATGSGRLRAAGRTFAISAKVRRIVLRLPSRPATGVVRVRFTLVGRGTSTGRITGRVEVRRG